MTNLKAYFGSSGCGRRKFLQIGAATAALSALKMEGARAQKSAGQPVSIDAHSHWAPEPYIKAVTDLGRSPRAAGKAIEPKLHDLKQRINWMDERGVKVHVMTLSGSMPWGWAKPDDAVRLAQIVNDAGIEAHQAYPDRFLIGAGVPIRDPAASVKELNRIAGKPGIRAVGLPNSLDGRDYIIEPEYEPFLARCEQLGYPLLFHPVDYAPNHFAHPDRLEGPNFLYNTLGFPFESATTATKMIFSGTLDKFPKLEVVLPHSGGCFPYVVGRVDHSINKKAVSAKLKGSMRDYMRRFYYDSLAYWPETLRFMIDLLGPDRIMIGTDCYATMDVEWPNALVEEMKIPAADRDLILRGNAAKLFRV
jgi:aminocarboxymuconate-semialdehyde decarboxylase